MTLRNLWTTGWKSLFPGKYKHIIQPPLRKVLAHFFILSTWGLLLFALLLVPGVLLTAQELTRGISTTERFDISMDVAQQAPVVLLFSPRVVLDTRPDAVPEGTVFITNDTVHTPVGVLDLDSLNDLSGNPSQTQTLLGIALLALIPALAVLGYLYIVLKAFLLSLLAALLLFFVFKAFRYRLAFAKAWKVGLLAAIPMMTLEWVVLPFARLFWLPLIVFIVYAFLGSWLTAQKEFAITSHKKGKQKF